MVQFAFIQFLSTAPKTTAILLLLAAALTAGIVEEIVFRGYIQKLIEDEYGVIFSNFIKCVLDRVLHVL